MKDRINENENNNEKKVEKSYWFGDFETCNKEGQEIPFMLCLSNEDGSIKKTFTGFNCDEQLMNYLPNNSIIYFHNLGYDGRILMKFGIKNNIMKGSKIIRQKHIYNGKHIELRDSYSIFTEKLSNFPACFPNAFKGTDIKKELFPYRYYTYDRINETQGVGIIDEVGNDETPKWGKNEKSTFKENLKMINAEKERGTFDMFKYCEFYCEQDVNVLRVGFSAFRSVCLQEPIKMDIYDITTVPSLANKFLNREVFYPNGNLYEISGSVKEYIMGAIYGGRCMTKNNKRYVVKDKLNDFDACSLYPSAMNRLFTIEGKPEIINECLIDNKIYDVNNPTLY
ncbi:hypothetical protein TVAG_236030 [Trichomonas vaginalis G3]|uniref:DNA-directed DNA polymerase n=1 Tax=Trichomonas vaginalis (strain ATCC PRA-98 / G3) TaxID=412133 RepID=A2F7J8_TRIV3|nr:organellar and viral DNA polymerase type B [Trichomonas vaginalis G3]EAX99105.1 hypothetical protein TVAG_236030 [Trichomonas vaginalis G3]KAI5498703.1 organellar and viral DNA polymerase type B [Trichomonas vaginalis G3]|eukprot:XP_001312035.1 hypothetical protein [Trichomonas vaginalis G3]